MEIRNEVRARRGGGAGPESVAGVAFCIPSLYPPPTKEVFVKVCSRCKAEKSLDCFSIGAGYCKPCMCEISREWRLANGDKVKEYRRRWKAAHAESERERGRERYRKDREKLLAYSRAYVMKHRAELSRKALEKYHSDPAHNIRTRIMARISESISVKNPRRNKWLDVLGYDVRTLKAHLESMFLPGMSWDNYGDWHIDHIVPISAFNYSSVDEIDFKRCWSLKNLRPLWATDNMRKSARLERPFQPSLAMVI